MRHPASLAFLFQFPTSSSIRRRGAPSPPPFISIAVRRRAATPVALWSLQAAHRDPCVVAKLVPLFIPSGVIGSPLPPCNRASLSSPPLLCCLPLRVVATQRLASLWGFRFCHGLPLPRHRSSLRPCANAASTPSLFSFSITCGSSSLVSLFLLSFSSTSVPHVNISLCLSHLKVGPTC